MLATRSCHHLSRVSAPVVLRKIIAPAQRPRQPAAPRAARIILSRDLDNNLPSLEGLLRLPRLTFRCRAQLAAENLFLRKQLAYQKLRTCGFD